MQNQHHTDKTTKSTNDTTNTLILAYKPAFITSNAFLTSIKKKYHLDKAGFSGTLDPFAKGALLIASGSYTKLLPFLPTSPKCYEAVLWLGAKSKSLDIENFLGVEQIQPFSEGEIKRVLESLQGKITYMPPSFSAKKVGGKRAYTLARIGEQVELSQSTMEVFSLQFLKYNHPFLHFSCEISKGGYVRSLGELIAKKLGTNGILSALTRTKEGDLRAYNGRDIFLNPLEILPFDTLKLDSSFAPLVKNGAKICLKNTKNGIFIVRFSDFFSIIEVLKDGNIKYLCNRICYANTL